MPNLMVVEDTGSLAKLLGKRGKGRLYVSRAPERFSQSVVEERPDALVVDLRSLRGTLLRYTRVRETLASRLPAVFVIGGESGDIRRLRAFRENPHVDFVRMPEESEGLTEEIVERVERLIQRRETEATPLPSQSGSALRHAVPDLHDPDSGRLDAERMAQLFGIPLAELARLLDKRPGTVAKTTDAPALQPGLRDFERMAAPLLQLAGTPERLRAWMNAPNPVLGGVTPMELVREGHQEAVAGLVERIALGEPA